jgi:hypothetical protein
MRSDFLNSVTKQFEYYKSLGEKTFSQLSDDELFWQYNESSNSAAIMVNHLWGNMMSRWTDFLNSDGEKEWRERDLEFEPVIESRDEMMKKWEEGWSCLFDALALVNEQNFDRKILIRNQEHTIVDAVHRQLAHYAYHIGQIVYVGRMLKDDAWVSLSIPKGKSSEFNQNKFAKGRHGGHFTDEIK